MAKKKYQVVGRVVGPGDQQGMPNARVEAWDKDLIVDDLVASAVTGADGRFKIEFDSSYFRDLFLDRRPDLFFKVFYEDRLVKSTEDSVLWNVEAGKTEITIEVDAAGGPKGDYVMAKKPDVTGKGGKGSGYKEEVKTTGGTKGGVGGKPGLGGKLGGGTGLVDEKTGGKKGGGGKGGKGGGKKGKGKYPPGGGSEFVCVIISRKCAIELLTALSLALGAPPAPKKKKGKKKGKGGKGGKGGGGKGGGSKGGGGKGGGGKGGGGKGGGIRGKGLSGKSGSGIKSGGSKPGGKSTGKKR